MSNCIILTLADGGENNKPPYQKYQLLQKEKNNYLFLDDYFDKVSITSEYSIHINFGTNVSTNDILVIREDKGRGGYSDLEKSRRTEIIHNALQYLKETSRVIIIAHGEVNEVELYNNSKIEQVMVYKTGGDERFKCEWKIVEDIVENIIKNQSPDFEKLLEKIRLCKVVPKIRKLIYKLEILIAPFSIQLQGINVQNTKSSVKLTKEYVTQLQFLLFKNDNQQEIHSERSLEKLLEEGNYIRKSLIVECVNNFKVIINKLLIRLYITADDCKEFLNNLNIVTKEVFFKEIKDE